MGAHLGALHGGAEVRWWMQEVEGAQANTRQLQRWLHATAASSMAVTATPTAAGFLRANDQGIMSARCARAQGATRAKNGMGLMAASISTFEWIWLGLQRVSSWPCS